MTNRLDRLEKGGFVKRLPDPVTAAACSSS